MSDTRRGYGRASLDRTPRLAGGDEPLSFVASSSAANRLGYSLRNDGWRLENFNANPVLLWMHNPFQPPIGQGRALAKNDKVILDEVRFDRDDELAAAVERKYRAGFLSAVSVSWDFVDADGAPVLDWWRLSDEQIRDEMFYDLAEVSAVSVPGDPRALIQQSRLALSRLGRELVELFDEQEHDPASAGDIQAAVRAELTRLGIIPGVPRPGIGTDAAQLVLAAFNMESNGG